MTLPQSTIDRIQKEAANKYIFNSKDQVVNLTKAHFLQSAFIDGAKSEAMRAQELLEALKMCYKSLCTYGEHPIIDKAVEQALKNYGEK